LFLATPFDDHRRVLLSSARAEPITIAGDHDIHVSVSPDFIVQQRWSLVPHLLAADTTPDRNGDALKSRNSTDIAQPPTAWRQRLTKINAVRRRWAQTRLDGKAANMSVVENKYFSDILCVWAYISQVRPQDPRPR
jgi:hypothetical protein